MTIIDTMVSSVIWKMYVLHSMSVYLSILMIQVGILPSICKTEQVNKQFSEVKGAY